MCMISQDQAMHLGVPWGLEKWMCLLKGTDGMSSLYIYKGVPYNHIITSSRTACL